MRESALLPALHGSLRVSTALLPVGGASAMAPYGVTVYVPDLRLGNTNSQHRSKTEIDLNLTVFVLRAGSGCMYIPYPLRAVCDYQTVFMSIILENRS